MFVGILIFARKLDWIRRIGLSFLLPYLFLVFAVTVFLRSSADGYNLILEPFKSYREYYTNDFTWFQIRANVLLFMPIGFFLPMVLKKPFFMPLIVGVGVSVTIEFLQLILRRGTCETDDVISNSIGLLIGFVVFWTLKAAFLALKYLIISLHKNYKDKHRG